MKKDIYIIKNTVNDKVYIGQAKNSAERWLKHLSAARKGYPYVIDKAIQKYGFDKFYYQILESNITNYDEREQYWIDFYNSRVPNGYNVAIGGNSLGCGIEHPASYFDSNEDILVIIETLKNTNFSMQNIAEQFGCAESVISQINLGNTYKQENLDYPIRKTRYDKEQIKRIHYSLQYELDKSMNQLAKEYKIDRSQLNEINQGRFHSLPGKKYPLRSGRVFSINKDFVDKIKDLLINTNIEQKEIAKQYNVSRGFVTSINKGSYYYDNNLSYPLRSNYQGNSITQVCFSPDEQKQIEELLIHSNKSIRDIAKEFDVCYSTIMNMNIGSITKYYNKDLSYPLRKK